MQGIQGRNRALNGDIVVVSLDSPDKWKVNHGAIQDFVEMKASEEDRRILMDSCVVNVKKEPSSSSSASTSNTANTSNTSKYVNENINISSVAKHYQPDNSAAKKEPEIIDITGDSDNEEANAASAPPPAVILNTKDPLLDIPEASASDYESDEVEDVEDKAAAEKEIQDRLSKLNLGKSPIKDGIVEIEDSDDTDVDDVVVETTVDDEDGNTTFETAVDTTQDTTEDLDNCSESTASSKKRRRRRGKKKKDRTESCSTLNTTTDTAVSSTSSR